MAPPKGIKLVEGTCACGHVGLQKEPDICGKCTRDQNRERDQKGSWAKYGAASKANSLMRKFYALPFKYQLEVTEKINAAVAVRNFGGTVGVREVEESESEAGATLDD